MTRGKIPKHLKDLYSRTVDGLTEEQSKQVAALLIKHKDAFSVSDDD